MKTKAVKESIRYTYPTFQDAILMTPLMDEVYNCACKELSVKAYNDLPEEERKQYRTPWSGSIPNAEKMYKLLTFIGFCTSHGDELKASLQKKLPQEV